VARIPVSFKNTTSDIKLYTSIVNLEDRSAFIKNALRFYLKYYTYEYKLIDLIKQEEARKNKPA